MAIFAFEDIFREYVPASSSSHMKSSDWLVGCFALVVVAGVAVIFVGHHPARPVASSRKPNGDLASQLIASLVRDLETAKAAGMTGGKIQQLASITQQATRELSGHAAELGLANNRRYSWYDSLLAVGSKESIELAMALMKQDAREREAAIANYLCDGEKTGQSATEKLLAAKTAADLDPVIRQLKDFTGKTPSSEATESTVRKELLRLLDFANRWQLQLAQRETGQSQQALKTLQALAQNDNIPRWLDRSVFLREIDAASRAVGKVPVGEIKPQITQIANKALTATTGEEIDKLLLEAGELHETMGNEDLLRLPFSKLTEFLKNLQDAIMAVDNQDSAKLRSSLSLLEAYYPDFDQHLGVPRSNLLRRVNDLRQAAAKNNTVPSARTATPRPETVMAKMVNLDSIQPHLSELKDSCVGLDPAGHPNWTMIQMLLDAFSKTAARLKAGQGMDRAVFENPLDPAVPQLRELQRQFDLLCMTRSFAEETGGVQFSVNLLEARRAG